MKELALDRINANTCDQLGMVSEGEIVFEDVGDS